MNNTTKKLLAMLMTVAMCFASIAPIMIFAETTSAADRIVTIEDFNDKAVNTDSGVIAVSQNGGFWFNDAIEGTSFTLEDQTLRYICRKGNLIDIRFYHDEYLDTSNANNKKAVDNMSDMVAKLEGQSFILSFRLKSFHDAITMKSTFTEHYLNEKGEIKGVTTDNVQLSDGTFVSGTQKTFTDANGVSFQGQANINHEIYANQWYVIEYAFIYDTSATSHNGKQGAYTHVNTMINGEVIEKAKLEHNYNRIDQIRLGQGCVDECEIDDLTVALGIETLAEAGDFDPHVQETHWIKATDKTPASNYAYSFAVVGDTQKVSRIDAINIYNNGEKVGKENDFEKATDMDAIYKWIVDNAESKKIEFVLGLGDITEYGYGEVLPDGNAYSDIEWRNCVEAISQMNGVVPYSIVRGNHDGLGKGVNKYFDNETYKNQFTANTQAAGFFADQGIANSYRAVKIGQTEYLFITLNYNPTDTVLEEAGKIIEQYPNHRVVITTHAYMYDDYTTISTEDDSSDYGNNDGEGIWDKLIRKYENICLVMSGHIGSDKVMVSQVQGDHGNTVTQMLIDFQVTDAHFGYTGNVVMLYFSEDGKQIEVETYSPLHDLYFHEKNQFKINETITYFDFDKGYTVCTSGSNATIGKNGGLTFINGGNATYTVDGTLNISNKDNGYFDVRLDSIGYDNIERDYSLSFDIMGVQNKSLGWITLADTGNPEGISWTSTLQVLSKGVITDAVGTQIATIPADRMANLEMILHYDPNKPIYSIVYDTDGKTPLYEVDGETKIAKTSVTGYGGFVSYTVLFDGKEINTYKLPATSTVTINNVTYVVPANFEHIDRFRMFHSGKIATTFSIDNLRVGFADLVEKKGGTELYKLDFEAKMEADLTKDGVVVLPASTLSKRYNYFYVANDYYNTSSMSNGLLHLVKGTADSAFIDTKIGYDLGGYLGDLTLSMKIKPGDVFDGNSLVQMNGYTKSDGSTGKASLVGTAKSTYNITFNGKSVALSQYRFSTLELMFRYDYSKMAYTSIDLFVNGSYVGTMDISSLDCKVVGYFRLFTTYRDNSSMDVEEIVIVSGAQTSFKDVTTEYIGYQTTTADAENFYDVRLLAVMTDANVEKYENVGFKVQIQLADGTLVTMPEADGVCKEVYSAVKATAGIDKTYTAEELGGKAIFALNCTDISTTYGAVTFTVTTYYTLAGQDSVNERTFVFTVDPTTDLPQTEVN